MYDCIKIYKKVCKHVYVIRFNYIGIEELRNSVSRYNFIIH